MKPMFPGYLGHNRLRNVVSIQSIGVLLRVLRGWPTLIVLRPFGHGVSYCTILRFPEMCLPNLVLIYCALEPQSQN
jgi:hypothetical protein